VNDAPYLRKCEGLASHDFWPQCRKAVMKWGAVKIFLFEIGDFSAVENALNLALQSGCEITTSLKFNQVDWTLTVKKAKR